MRVVLFDAILEDHTCRGLEKAFRDLGHDVLWTGPIWRGHRFPTERADSAAIQARLDEVLTPRPDLFFNFRASTLPPERLASIRPAVGTMAVWLPDDPILYEVCYRHVVDSYDLVLHCGYAAVLEHYRARHGRCGVNFPFWTDADSLGFGYDPDQASIDAVFLGSTAGKVRRARYGELAALPLSVRILGRVDDDPAGIRGEFLGEALYDPSTLRRELCRARVGVTIPQFFRDYGGHQYDFPALASLGYYDMPSRVVRYAAAGLPIAAIGHDHPPAGFPEVVTAPDGPALARRLQPLLGDRAGLLELSRQTHARYRRSFSALSRARFLVELVSDRAWWGHLPVADRVELFTRFPGESEPPTGRLEPPIRGS